MNSLALGFLARLRLAFAAMIVLVLVQAAIALWLVQTASYHEVRSRLSHDMLNQYVDLSANEQRLKVWFAQLLLVQDPQTETRDLLLLRIERGLAQLNALATTELERLRARIMVAAAAACTVILALILVMVFSQRLRQPVAALSRGAAALQTEQYAHRIPEIGDHEFRDVARRINMMAAEIEQHRQREIAMRGGDKAASVYRDSMTVIAETTRQLSARVAERFMLARRDDEQLTLQAAPVRINDVVEQAIAQATALAGDQGPAVAADVMLNAPDVRDLEITTHRQQLLQCLMVLYDNAVRYSPSAGTGGHIRTTLSGDTSEITVTITDNGIGINAAETRDAFTRHYRGEAARRLRPDDAGLGLSIARRIAQALGGTLTLMQGVAANGQARGTVAQLVLPRQTQSALSS